MKTFITDMRTIKIIFCVAISFILWQCNSNNGKPTSATANQSDTLKKSATEKKTYMLPSPDQILSDIISRKIVINQQLVNPMANAEKYLESKAQAINLGVYVADFAYLNLNKNKTNALEYFKLLRDLAQKINIYGSFDEVFFNRVQANLSNNDSLISISQGLFFNMSETLENSNRPKVYALISAGALIESLYLSAMSITNYSDYSAMVNKIFEQKSVFNNFYAFLSQQKKDRDISSVLNQLDNLKVIFEKPAGEPQKTTVTKDKPNHLTNKVETGINVDEAMFNDFKMIIGQARNEFVNITNK
jgi:hypothetical protein